MPPIPADAPNPDPVGAPPTAAETSAMAAGQSLSTGQDLDWRDDITPISKRFDDPYFSINGGLDETHHVFLGGNDLARRWGEMPDGTCFEVAELGFGTGLNLWALIDAWRGFWAGNPGARRLAFTSFEAYPLNTAQTLKALSAFPKAQAIAAPLLDQWQLGADASGDVMTLTLAADGITAQVRMGDASRVLRAWQGQADAWFLDGFSPAKNPEMWAPDLMALVGTHTKPGGSFATYTAAGHVRRALADAGFDVQRGPGYGHKRHMSFGSKTIA